MASEMTGVPSKDGDPLWQQDFPINRAEELGNSRRQFLKFLGLTSLAFFTGTLGVAIKSLVEEQRATDLPDTRVVGLDELQVGASKPFHYPDESYPAILIRLSDKEYKAYESRCTHLLCPVLYQREGGEGGRGRIYCPCHEGVFDPDSGEPLAGPPPRRLNGIRIEVRSDGVYAVGREA